MRIKAQFEERIPPYALSYLINGDMNGLSDEDCHNIDKWLAEFDVTGREWMDISINNMDEEEYFTSMPAFGLPCNVMDCTVTVFEKEEGN